MLDFDRFIRTYQDVEVYTEESTFVWPWIGGPSAEPDLDPKRPRKLPLRPGLRVELWKWLKRKWTEFTWSVEEDVIVRKFFCEETIKDSCGNEHTICTSGTKEEVLNSTRTLLEKREWSTIHPLNYLGGLTL